ncbi:hypothetical protein [Vibrio sp. 10N.261.55.A7]|uniref:hypothetical protein n=1 Tax=Vibrio sp. 10N.261.55.A7 TaxID=1880851 RepID=UPI001056D8CE|nr:hypothetical protein [Vibrio sp. 10N.261.55.A7]
MNQWISNIGIGMKAMFLVGTVSLIALAINSEGLIRATAELFAFLCLISFVISVKQSRKTNIQVEAEEL